MRLLKKYHWPVRGTQGTVRGRLSGSGENASRALDLLQIELLLPKNRHTVSHRSRGLNWKRGCVVEEYKLNLDEVEPHTSLGKSRGPKERSLTNLLGKE